MFTGLITALITPFRDGVIDEDTLTELIEAQVAAGVDGIVPAGTTGESPTLTAKEHLHVIARAVEVAAGRIKVIAGAGANSTAEAIHLTQEAQRLGADATMQVTPYYNKPSQEGLYQHFSAIAQASDLPIMLYSVPGRSVIEIEVETAVRLRNDHKNIVALKEAGGRTSRVIELRSALGADFQILCGDDPLTLPFLTAGACGLVSVTSNLIPAERKSMVTACLGNDLAAAQESFYQLLPLTENLMGLAVNPLPIKEACAIAGMCTAEFRLPLVNLSADEKAQLTALLTQHNLV